MSGQKVTLGKAAPVSHEAAGPVHPESLAAESLANSGAFAGNEGVRKYTTSTLVPDARSGGPEGSSDSSGSQNGSTAPSYATAPLWRQRLEAERGPHGKNLIKGGFAGDAPAGFPEPGSKNDPARVAVKGLVSGAGGTGPGAKVSTESGGRFAALDGTQA